MDKATKEKYIKNKWIISLQGREYITHAGLLDAAGDKLKSIETEFQNDINGFGAVFKATVSMTGGKTFTGHGDACKENVNSIIAKHLLRMAETRAINRALRFATNIGMCSVDELGGDVIKEGKKEVTKTKANSRGKYTCTSCSVDVAEVVKKYSEQHHGRVLCRDCQKKAKEPVTEPEDAFISDELE